MQDSAPFSHNEQFGAATAMVAGNLAPRLDESGEPLLHVMKIASKQTDPVCRTIAVLHEVVGDGVCSLEQLQGIFEPVIVDGVTTLTQRHKEPFRTWIERVALNPFAVPVMLACLWDKMDRLSKASVMNGDQIDLLEQYQWATSRLLSGRMSLDPPVPEQQLVQIDGIH